MRKLIIGTLSTAIGAGVFLYSFPVITGNVVSESSGVNLLPLFGSILLVCGVALFFLEAKERKKN